MNEKSFTKKVLSNFNISRNKVPGEFLRNYLIVKKAYSNSNRNAKKLTIEKAKLITESIDRLLKKDAVELEKLLPIDIFQSGGGTSVNMPINELICKYSKEKIHPNDDVNMSQSSNDTFPSVCKITTYIQLIKLLKSLDQLGIVYKEMIVDTKGIKKIGRTHLQDALEIEVCDELSAHLETINKNIQNIKYTLSLCTELPLGATALGSMQNINKEIRKDIIEQIKKEYKIKFKTPHNYFEAVSSSGDLTKVSFSIQALASDLLKIVKDIILLSSGPNGGLNEIIVREVQAGSSIMPGKVNPSIFEAVCMVCFRVIGNAHTIDLANQNAQLQLQAFNPIIAFTLFENIEILTNAIDMYREKGLMGVSFNKGEIKKKLDESYIFATKYSEKLGYSNIASLYKKSLNKNLDLKNLINKEIKKKKIS